jgi:hypothetical protein
MSAPIWVSRIALMRFFLSVGPLNQDATLGSFPFYSMANDTRRLRSTKTSGNFRQRKDANIVNQPEQSALLITLHRAPLVPRPVARPLSLRLAQVIHLPRQVLNLLMKPPRCGHSEKSENQQ